MKMPVNPRHIKYMTIDLEILIELSRSCHLSNLLELISKETYSSIHFTIMSVSRGGHCQPYFRHPELTFCITTVNLFHFRQYGSQKGGLIFSEKLVLEFTILGLKQNAPHHPFCAWLVRIYQVVYLSNSECC